MATIPNTTGTPEFIRVKPDWSLPVMVLTSWDTSIVANRDGGEQRARRREKPRYSIHFQRQALTPTEMALRRVESIRQLGAPVVIPNWTYYLAVSSVTAHSATFGSAITSPKFKVGGWVYTEQGADFCFRKITVIAGSVLTFSSAGADIYPAAWDYTLFSAGARVYPCILGVRGGNRSVFRSEMVDSQTEVMEVEEL